MKRKCKCILGSYTEKLDRGSSGRTLIQTDKKNYKMLRSGNKEMKKLITATETSAQKRNEIMKIFNWILGTDYQPTSDGWRLIISSFGVFPNRDEDAAKSETRQRYSTEFWERITNPHQMGVGWQSVRSVPDSVKEIIFGHGLPAHIRGWRLAVNAFRPIPDRDDEISWV